MSEYLERHAGLLEMWRCVMGCGGKHDGKKKGGKGTKGTNKGKGKSKGY